MAVADSVVTFLLQNLTQLVVGEVKLLSGVESKIESLCKELKFIDIFLKSSDGKRNNPFVKEVVNQIRDVAYRVEDVVDTYIAKVTKQKSRNILKKLFHSKDHAMMLHDVNAEIEQIRRSIDEIYKNKERYNIQEGDFRSGNNETGELLRKRRRNVEEDYVMHDPSIVLEELKKWRSRRSVVSIVGMGGLGKTTLARKIFNTDPVKEVFPLRAWGYVSDDYRPRELWLSLLMCLTASTSGYKDHTEEQLKEEVRKCLKGKKYLIVLDDIWRNEVWDDLQDAFPDEPGRGSRILLTSRIREVAFHAKATLTYNLPLLNEEDSWKLFSTKVLGGEECPSELEPLGRSIVERCGGLPLAIIVLAGLFARKEKSQREWSRIKDHGNLHMIQDKSKVMDILKLSYDNLPPRLKPCFLYFGMYPEDYEIPVKQLIRLWIAEGFMVQETGCSNPPEPEAVADYYLDELVDLNLVQMASKRSDGGVKTCRIHDLLRELCISESKDEKFFDICTSTLSNPRRLSCQCSGQCISSTKSYQSCTRSFILSRSFIFSAKMSGYLSKKSIPERLKLARVLDFGSMDVSSAPNGLVTLVHLRYLRIYFTGIYEYPLEDILHLTECLWNLETLHIRCWRDFWNQCKMSTKVLLKFKRLRHLDTDGIMRLQPEHMSGLDNETISDLQTLYSVFLDPKTMSVVNKRFPKLRKLGVVADSPEDGEFLNLQPLSNLHTLKIYQTLDLPSDACAFLSNLTKITLINWVRFESHFMKTLGQLTNLQVLKLQNQPFFEEQDEFDINCAAGEFPKLEMLKMEDISVHMWTLEKGAMPHLQRLVIIVSRSLSELPEELWSLTALREVNVRLPNHNLVNSLQNVEVKNGCKLVIGTPLTELIH